MENTYWNKKGKYQKDYDEIIKLMPYSGNADTLAGEIIRAGCRIGYDYWNNGMCNNTSGALNFLKKHKVITDDIFSTLYEPSLTQKYADSNDIEPKVNELIDLCVLFILNNPETRNTPNEDDIFNYQEDDLVLCESCDCEIENASAWTSLCDDCVGLDEEAYLFEDEEED